MSDLYTLAKQTSKFPINPDDSEEFIIDDRVALEMTPIDGKDDYIHFISIRALQPGKKHGSIAMKKIIKLVDDNNITLLGKIIPYHTQDISKSDLRKWYIKFGCKPLDPSNKNGIWIRPAKNQIPTVDIDPITKFKIEKGLSNIDYIDRIRCIKIASITIIAVLLVYLLRTKKILYN